MENKFESFSFEKRIKSMLRVDFRRAYTTPLFYIMLGISFLVPILILVMTTMMDGMTTTDPNTGAVTVIEGFENVWQILGSVSAKSSEGAGMSMDLVSMCNINMLFFGISVPVCVFIADDFRSGYSKNLFTVRSEKGDYVISKTLVGINISTLMLVAFFVGSLIGGAVSGLSFEMTGFNSSNLFFCMLSKIFAAVIFVAIFTLASVIAKHRLWLSIILSLGISMLLFTMIPMITPLDCGFVNVILTLVGGIGFAVGLGAVSRTVLSKTALV